MWNTQHFRKGGGWYRMFMTYALSATPATISCAQRQNAIPRTACILFRRVHTPLFKHRRISPEGDHCSRHGIMLPCTAGIPPVITHASARFIPLRRFSKVQKIERRNLTFGNCFIPLRRFSKVQKNFCPFTRRNGGGFLINKEARRAYICG